LHNVIFVCFFVSSLVIIPHNNPKKRGLQHRFFGERRQQLPYLRRTQSYATALPNAKKRTNLQIYFDKCKKKTLFLQKNTKKFA